MTAWVKKGTREEAGVITDYVDPRCVGLVTAQHGWGCAD